MSELPPSPFPAADDPQRGAIDEILRRHRRVAVVGISDNPARASHEVASYLVSRGFDVVPVNPRLASVLGRPCVSDLAEVRPVPEIVDVFRRSEEAAAVVDAAIAVGAKAVWLQEGVRDDEAAARARAAGLLVVMDRCILKEHARLAAETASEA